MLVAVLVGLATIPLTGGRLGALADARLRRGPALLGALVVQVLITTVVPGWPDGLLRVAHFGSYGLAAVFLWSNRRMRGLWVIAAGALCNFAAIAANGGVMPASAAARRSAGIADNGAFQNSTVVDGAHLRFLGDVFAIPDGWPLANVFSIGDVVIAIGAVIVIHALARSRPEPTTESSRDGVLAA